ncbi:hypothetical protein BBJ29_010053, partial [Phytophthora kernoviae]
GTPTSLVEITNITVDGLTGTAENLYDIVANPDVVSDWTFTNITVDTTSIAERAAQLEQNGRWQELRDDVVPQLNQTEMAKVFESKFKKLLRQRVAALKDSKRFRNITAALEEPKAAQFVRGSEGQGGPMRYNMHYHMPYAAAPHDPREPRFPVIVKHPTFDDIKANFGAGDYTRWMGITAVSFPVGYVFGVKLHRRVAVPSMWVTGVLGSLGGFLLAYQNSSFRLQGYKANPVEVKQYITSKEE